MVFIKYSIQIEWSKRSIWKKKVKSSVKCLCVYFFRCVYKNCMDNNKINSYLISLNSSFFFFALYSFQTSNQNIGIRELAFINTVRVAIRSRFGFRPTIKNIQYKYIFSIVRSQRMFLFNFEFLNLTEEYTINMSIWVCVSVFRFVWHSILSFSSLSLYTYVLFVR